MYTSQELLDIVRSFESGHLHYEFDWKYRHKLSKEGAAFREKWKYQDRVPVNYNVVFDDLEIQLGRVPSLSEVQDLSFQRMKAHAFTRNEGIDWDKEKELVFKERVYQWYKSHMLEEVTISRLKHLYPDCNIWADREIDYFFGVDIVFEDKKTGLNYYFHITQEGNDIKYKQDRWNQNQKKREEKGFIVFYRDCSFRKGHHTLHYLRENTCKYYVGSNPLGTKYLGGQPFFTTKYLQDQVEYMRTLHTLHHFDDSVNPKELGRFYSYLDKVKNSKYSRR